MTWTTERVPPPEQFRMPKSDKFRDNWDKIFGKKDEDPTHEGEADAD